MRPRNPLGSTRVVGPAPRMVVDRPAAATKPRLNPDGQVVIPGAAGPGLLKRPRYFTDAGRTGAKLKPTADKPARGHGLTLEQQASKLVDQIISAQLGPLLQTQAHDSAVNRAFAIAAGRLIANSAASESSLFSGLGSDLLGAQGASQGAFNQAQQQGQASTGADLAAIGAPQAQQQAVSSGIGQDFAQNAAVANAPLVGGQGIAQAYAGNDYKAIPESFLGNALFGQAAQAQQQYQDRLQLESQRPQLLQSILGQLISQQTAQQNLSLKQQQAALQAWAAQQLAGYRSGNLALSGKRAAISQQNANTSVFRANTSAKQGAARIAQGQQRVNQGQQRVNIQKQKLYDPNPTLSAKYGHIVDSFGNTITGKNGKPIPVAKSSSSKKGGFTALQRQRFSGTSTTLAANARKGFTDAKGVAHPPLSYQGAIEEAQKEGLPLPIFLPILNRYYQPGEAGRPVPPNPYPSQGRGRRGYRGRNGK